MIKSTDKIQYKNKTIDTGLIIGSRKYRWTLKQRYEPCWAKNGTYISQLSPHKKDFVVYIPFNELKKNVNKEILIGDKDVKRTILINSITKHTIDYEITKEIPYEKWKAKRTVTTNKENTISHPDFVF